MPHAEMCGRGCNKPLINHRSVSSLSLASTGTSPAESVKEHVNLLQHRLAARHYKLCSFTCEPDALSLCALRNCWPFISRGMRLKSVFLQHKQSINCGTLGPRTVRGRHALMCLVAWQAQLSRLRLRRRIPERLGLQQANARLSECLQVQARVKHSTTSC